MSRFAGNVEYKRTEDQTLPSVSRFAGMPIGVQLYSDWIVYRNQFLRSSDLPVNGVNWAITIVDTDADAADVIEIAEDASPPRLTVTTNNNALDSFQMQYVSDDGPGSWLGLATDKDIWFECMLRFRDATMDDDTVEEVGWFAGLAIEDTTVLAGASDFIGFSKVARGTDATQAINFVSGVGAGAGALRGELLEPTEWTTELTTSGVSEANTAAGRVLRRAARIVGPNQWTKLSMLIQPHAAGTLCEAYCWVDDIFQSSMGTNGRIDIPAANIPTNALALTFALQNAEAVAHTMDIANIILAKRIRQDCGLLVE